MLLQHLGRGVIQNILVLHAHELKLFIVYQVKQLLIILPPDFFFMLMNKLRSQVFISYHDSQVDSGIENRSVVL